MQPRFENVFTKYHRKKKKITTLKNQGREGGDIILLTQVEQLSFIESLLKISLAYRTYILLNQQYPHLMNRPLHKFENR